MNLSVNPINIIKTNYSTTKQTPYLKKLSCDTVSFSSNPKALKDSRINQAVDLGYKIYDNSVKNKGLKVAEIIKEKEPNVQVLPISELAKERFDASNYAAYFSFDFSDDIEPIDIKLYASLEPKNDSRMLQLIYAMEIAHEYTHLKQQTDRYDTEFLQKIAKGNREYLTLLNGLAGRIFSAFDTQVQANQVLLTLNEKDIEAFSKYSQITPVAKNIHTNGFLKANNFSNQDEFNEFVDDVFEYLFNGTLSKIAQDSTEVEKRVQDAFKTYISSGGSIEQLKEDSKKYCAHCAKTEIEAYTTESKLAKRILKVKDGLNIDAFVIYYDLLAKALEQ